jgi:hypothetical protein
LHPSYEVDHLVRRHPVIPVNLTHPRQVFPVLSVVRPFYGANYQETSDCLRCWMSWVSKKPRVSGRESRWS